MARRTKTSRHSRMPGMSLEFIKREYGISGFFGVYVRFHRPSSTPINRGSRLCPSPRSPSRREGGENWRNLVCSGANAPEHTKFRPLTPAPWWQAGGGGSTTVKCSATRVATWGKLIQLISKLSVLTVPVKRALVDCCMLMDEKGPSTGKHMGITQFDPIKP